MMMMKRTVAWAELLHPQSPELMEVLMALVEVMLALAMVTVIVLMSKAGMRMQPFELLLHWLLKSLSSSVPVQGYS